MVSYVGTKEQVADSLTKFLPPQMQPLAREHLSLYSASSLFNTIRIPSDPVQISRMIILPSRRSEQREKEQREKEQKEKEQSERKSDGSEGRDGREAAGNRSHFVSENQGWCLDRGIEIGPVGPCMDFDPVAFGQALKKTFRRRQRDSSDEESMSTSSSPGAETAAANAGSASD